MNSDDDSGCPSTPRANSANANSSSSNYAPSTPRSGTVQARLSDYNCFAVSREAAIVVTHADRLAWSTN